MKYRKLRIAWSVMWGSIALLTSMLWVRSYWVADWLRAPNVNVMSDRGSLRFRDVYNINQAQPKLVGNRTERTLPFTGAHVGSYPPDALLPVYVGKTVAYWPFVATLGLLSTIIWIPVPSRFSVRTLLIATTLVAIVLGLIVWARHR